MPALPFRETRLARVRWHASTIPRCSSNIYSTGSFRLPYGATCILTCHWTRPSFPAVRRRA